MDGIRIALLDVMGTTIATYLHTCLSGYVTCKHNLGPVNCVCLPCDSSPITERVCTHNTQPSDRVNLFIYYHDLNTFRHLDRQAFYANSWPNSRRNAIVARFEARSIQSSIARRRWVSIRPKAEGFARRRRALCPGAKRPQSGAKRLCYQRTKSIAPRIAPLSRFFGNWANYLHKMPIGICHL